MLRSLTEQFVEEDKKCMVFFLSKKRLGGWDKLAPHPNCTIKYSPFKNHFLGYLYFIPYLVFLTSRYRIARTLSSQTLVNALIGFSKRIGILRKTKVIVRESTSVFKQLNGLKAQRYRMAYAIGYSKVDLVIFQTEVMKNNLFQRIPWIERKLHSVVLRNPINVAQVLNQSLIPDKVFEGKKFIVAAGRLIPVKGFDLLIQAFKDISAEFPSLELWILGYGDEKENLENLSSELGIYDKVKLLGFRENPYQYFRNAEACVVSSLVEGFPNVLLQMMAVNTKVVSTLCAGGIDQIEGIYTCKPGDSDLLKSALNNVLSTDTVNNRISFDKFLQSRSFTSYIESLSLAIPES